VKDGRREIKEGVKTVRDIQSETREQKVFEMQELYEKNKILYGFILEIYCSVTGNGLCLSPVLTLIRRRL
jgi:hypothetical protein